MKAESRTKTPFMTPLRPVSTARDNPRTNPEIGNRTDFNSREHSQNKLADGAIMPVRISRYN